MFESSISPRTGSAMSWDQFTALLANRVMGWRVGPARILIQGRGWISRWRFQPLTRLEDALRMLEKAATTYTLTLTADGTFVAHIQVETRTGSASGESKAATITIAVARAMGIEVPDEAMPPSVTTGVRRRGEEKKG